MHAVSCSRTVTPVVDSPRRTRHACTTSRHRNVVFANTASAGFAVHVSTNAESKVTQDAVTFLLVDIGGCERPRRTATNSPPFLWKAKQAAPLLLSKSVVGGTAVRQRNLHRTPPEVEKSRTSTQSRAPSDTNKKYTTPGMPTPKPRQCFGHCHPTPGSAPRQHPAVRRACSIAAGQDVKVFEEGTSPATNFSTRRTNVSATFGLDQIEIESGPAGP